MESSVLLLRKIYSSVFKKTFDLELGNLMKIIFAIFLIFMLVACRGQVFSEKSMLAPLPAGMGYPPKDSPPDYLEGWYDGCYTGLSTMNQEIYKSFYGYKQNVDKADNIIYYQAWRDAYTYCRHYSFRYVWNPLDKKRTKGLLTDKDICVLCPDEFNR